MPKKYVRCRVLHPGKKEFVSADIEIDVTEEVVRIDNPRLTFDATVAPVHNDLIAAGIDSTWPSKKPVIILRRIMKHRVSIKENNR